MRFSTLALVGIAAQPALSFPSYLSEAMIQIRTADQKAKDANAKLEQREPGCPFAKREASAEAKPGCPYAREKRQAPGVTPPFDASQQYVSNTGSHAFKAPSATDQRGPCPGLNAMANHGYMPHNGIGQMSDFVQGTAAVFGMGSSNLASHF